MKPLHHPLLVKVSISIMSALLLSGCSPDTTDLDVYIKKIKARPAAPIDPIPEIKPYVRYVYPGHDVDPFDSKILAPDPASDPNSQITPDHNRTAEFLEGFPLDSLRMVGTVNQNNEQWALIRIPDGAVHRVKVGNYLGKNYGKVINIEERRVVVMEIIENGFGGYKERENAIALSDPTEDKKHP